jgi:hypothetical protein
MTHEELESVIRETFDNVLQLRRIKGVEYSEQNDALANFRHNART